MASVADHAEAFAHAAKSGRPARAVVDRRHAELFLRALLREGIAIAKDCLDAIGDPKLRRIVETVLFGTAAGAVLGAAVGACVGAPALGAGVGAAVGLAASAFAVVVTLGERDGRLVIDTAALPA